ncbi:MAG: hypothetical protein JXL82_01090 [Candidatus Omnitrophica bacterium]|nr:hypothetical protein [Candidatus Omnitrophota bacterium]
MNKNFKSFVFILFIANFIFSQQAFALEGPPKISMDLQDASLKDVLKILSMQSNLNFVASEMVQDKKVTLYMDNVPLKEAMDKIFKANNLSYDLDKEASIFIVKDWGQLTVETITEVFYLKHAMVSSSSLKEEMKNNMTQQSTDSSSTSTSSSSSSDTGSDDKGKWKVEDDAGITQSIKSLLSKEGSVIEDFRTNSLIVTDIPSRMEIVRSVIKSLDVAVPQVLLEVEMLDVSKNAVDQLGVNWPMTLATGDFTQAFRVFNPFGKKGTSGQGSTLEVTKGTEFLKEAATWAAPHFGPVVFGVLNSKVSLDFLKTQTDTKFLARPKILTLSNETAEIKIVSDEAIGLNSSTQGSGAGGATQTITVERAQTGVTLRVTPQVNLDTGEITMFLNPSVSEASTSLTTLTAGIANNTATGQYTFRNPETRTTKSTVRVKDGETVVLGGMIVNQSTTTEKKIPILGDIPILGKAFRHKETTPGKERELLVFITPRIIKDGVMMDKGSLDVQPIKKMMLPWREQSTVSVINRQSSINTYLNTLEKQR